MTDATHSVRVTARGENGEELETTVEAEAEDGDVETAFWDAVAHVEYWSFDMDGWEEVRR